MQRFKSWRIWRSAWLRLGIVLVVIVVILCVAAIAQFWQGTSPNWLLGVAASIAALIALFGDVLRTWIWHPSLTVSYCHGEDYVVTTVLRTNVGGQEAQIYYFSLRVFNDGTRSAEIVEVWVGDLHQRKNNEWRLIRRYSLNLKWAYLGVARLPTLAPKMERFCNIGHIIDPKQREYFQNEDPQHNGMSNTTVFSLDLEEQPNALIHLLEAGEYRLTVLVVAANHKPIRKTLEFNVMGKWVADDLDGMLQDGIKITLT